MRLTAYVILLFSLMVSAYFLGYQPIGLTILDQIYNTQGGQGLTLQTIFTAMANATLDSQGTISAALALGAIAAVTTSLAVGFSSIYILPMVILIGIFNLLVFPFSFLLDMPQVIAVPIVVLFNILTVLTVTNFIRGGGT